MRPAVMKKIARTISGCGHANGRYTLTTGVSQWPARTARRPRTVPGKLSEKRSKAVQRGATLAKLDFRNSLAICSEIRRQRGHLSSADANFQGFHDGCERMVTALFQCAVDTHQNRLGIRPAIRPVA